MGDYVLSGMERLAVAQAMYKLAAPMVKTGDPDSLRGLADADLLASYEGAGVKGVDLRVGGAKVGSLSVRTSKAGPVVTDQTAWQSWLRSRREEGDMRPRRVVTVDASKLADNLVDALAMAMPAAVSVAWEAPDVLKGLSDGGEGRVVDPASGEVVPGVEWATGGAVGTTMRGCEPDKVSAALAALGMSMEQASRQLAAPLPPALPVSAEGSSDPAVVETDAEVVA